MKSKLIRPLVFGVCAGGALWMHSVAANFRARLPYRIQPHRFDLLHRHPSRRTHYRRVALYHSRRFLQQSQLHQRHCRRRFPESWLRSTSVRRRTAFAGGRGNRPSGRFAPSGVPRRKEGWVKPIASVPQTRRAGGRLPCNSRGRLIAKEEWDHSCWAKETCTTHESALGCEEKSG